MTIEKRINKKLLSYWQDLKGDNDDFPAEARLNPEDLQDVWDNCFLIKINEDGQYKFNYLGKAIISAQNGESLVGRDVYSSIICLNDGDLTAILNEVIRTRKPVSQESEFVNKYGITVKFRRCLLPLKSNAEKIEYILGGVRWKSS